MVDGTPSEALLSVPPQQSPSVSRLTILCSATTREMALPTTLEDSFPLSVFLTLGAASVTASWP